MMRALKLIIFAPLFFFLTTTFAAQDIKPHVILIGIDAFMPEIYLHPGHLKKEIPNILFLKNHGSFAIRNAPVFPSITYVNFTSMVTGQYPENHCIISNHPLNSDKWTLDSKKICSPLIYNLASKQGLTTAVINWPVSYNAKVPYRIVQNYQGDILPVNKKTSYKQGQMTRLIIAGSTPHLIQRLSEKIGTPFHVKPIGVRKDVRHYDNETGNLTAQLIKDYKPRLVLTYFEGIDQAGHFAGIPSRIRDKNIINVDQQIGKIIQATKTAGIYKKTTFILVGDHGMSQVHYQISLPTLLKKSNTQSQLNFYNDGESVFMIANPGISKTQQAKAIRKLTHFIRTHLSEKIKIFSKADLTQLHVDKVHHIQLGLEVKGKATFVSTLNNNHKIISYKTLLKGEHGALVTDNPDMYAGFITSGFQIKPHTKIQSISNIDIMPTIAKLLSLKIGKVDGKALAKMPIKSRKKHHHPAG